MKLNDKKMSKSFNVKVVKQLLADEDKFISEIFSIMPLPTNELVAQNGHGEYDQEIFNKEKEKHTLATNGKTKRAQTFEELHAKFNELKGKKLNYKDKLLKKNLKNKIQKKSKREERSMQKKLARTERACAEMPKGKEEIDVPKIPKQKPIFNSQGNMVFSRFDFSEVGSNKKKNIKIEKDPKKILQQIEEKKKKVKELEEIGEKDKAQEMKEKEAWKTVLAKAAGEKIKDDPELLKRTIKREEQKKKSSSKKWQARKEKVDKSKQDRQQKRSENILKRKRDVKTNKLKKAAKKGRIIPGF